MLNNIAKPNTKPMRTLLMNIKTKDRKGTLYLGINKYTRGNIVFFTFPTTLETEACNMMKIFCTYLVHKTSSGVLLYMKLDVVEQAAETTWDAEKHEANSEENKTLEWLIHETDGIDWLQDFNRSKEV